MWDHFCAAGHLPSHGNRSAWGSTELAETDFILSPYGHGWHLDRRAFDAMLVAAAEEAGASRASATDVAWEPSSSGGILRLRRVDGESCVRAWAVLDCSGRVGTIARQHGARRVHRDKLVAIAALHVPGRSGDVDSTTLVEAARDGWWYTALLPGDRRIFVYLTDGDLLNVRAARDVGCWLQRLRQTHHLRDIQERFRYRVHHAPTVVPARSSKLRSALGRGWLAAGDAALSFDPLSSQGIITAMSTGRDAAESILDRRDGDPTAITSYLSRLDQLDRDYMAQRARYYGLEHRWADLPFWRRRSATEEP